MCTVWQTGLESGIVSFSDKLNKGTGIIMREYQSILRDLREDHDYTQEEVAHILGTSQTMYARYERGANELPIHHLITFCRYYGVTADYFLGLISK